MRQPDHRSRLPAVKGASRAIVPMTRIRILLSRCQKRTRKQRRTKFETCHGRRKRGGKSDPWVRFLVKECVPTREGRKSRPQSDLEQLYQNFCTNTRERIHSNENV